MKALIMAIPEVSHGQRRSGATPQFCSKRLVTGVWAATKPVRHRKQTRQHASCGFRRSCVLTTGAHLLSIRVTFRCYFILCFLFLKGTLQTALVLRRSNKRLECVTSRAKLTHAPGHLVHCRPLG